MFQMSRSNEHQVVLRKVQISSSGSYKCEVSNHEDTWCPHKNCPNQGDYQEKQTTQLWTTF